MGRVRWAWAVCARAIWVGAGLAVALPAAAQSSREEAVRWCTRQDAAMAWDTVIAGCTWLIRSGRETTEVLAFAFYNRGLGRTALGDRVGAVTDYNEAIRLNPLNAFAFTNRGGVRFALGDRAGALEQRPD